MVACVRWIRGLMKEKSVTFVLSMEQDGVKNDLQWRMNFIRELEHYVKKACPFAEGIHMYYVGDNIKGFKLEQLGAKKKV